MKNENCFHIQGRENKIAVPANRGNLLHPASNFTSYLNVFRSDLYRIVAFNCYHDAPYRFAPGYTDEFRISLTRTGYFTYDSYRKTEEEYNGRISIDKAGCEYQVIQQQPGAGSCTMFHFTEEAFAAIEERYHMQRAAFFRNQDVFSSIINSSAEADVLHSMVLNQLAEGDASRLQIDCLVAELVDVVIQLLSSEPELPELPARTKRFHIKTIERAKEFLLQNFSRDISLVELARHCYVSPFYFTRLFKQFCGSSPFSYLQRVRLKQAEMLIRTTKLPVTDVCFQSGFKRLDYFSAAFSKVYGTSPTKYRPKAA